jgi:UDPglucose 6-dehydrogenase
MQRKIAIIGLGYVGLPSAACLASFGHKIICVDKDKEKVQKLKEGIAVIYEPGLEELLKQCCGNMTFTDNLEMAVRASEVIFIAVGTPSKKNGRIDMHFFEKAAEEIGKAMDGFKVIVNKSTVSVGTADWVKKEIKKYYKGEFLVVSNPEFLREGSAVKDFFEADRVVLGVEDKKAEKIMLDIYSPVLAPKVVTDFRSAEMIKYASNAFLAGKISFINEISNICEKVNADVKMVANGMGLDKRIGKSFLNAGIGYGGSCFPKDIGNLIKMADDSKYNFRLLREIEKVNEDQKIYFVKKIKKFVKKAKGNIICVWGIAFKPNTDDVRKSPAVEIMRQLLIAGFKIQAYDPAAMENIKKEFKQNKSVFPFIKNIKFCRTPVEAAENADLLAITTEWPEFLKIDMQKIKKVMRHHYFLDGRNQFNPEEIKKIGFYYQGMGTK